MVDLIVHNAVVYTVDSSFSKAEAFAVYEGRFEAVGSSKEILEKYQAERVIDLKGKPVYPGFIDAHCHFYGYGQRYLRADLVGTRSYDEVIERVVAHAKEVDFPWVLGRGWDQNDWTEKSFPSNDTLNKLFPDRPVLLTRIDGHAAIANRKALDLAGVTAETKVGGGVFETEDGRLTGVLIDKAIDTVRQQVPELSRQQQEKSLLKAQEACFGVGLTTVDDAGLDKSVIDLIDSLHQTGDLKMRIYAMASPTKANLEHFLEHGPYKTDRLHVRSFKFYADGALGSRGALLLEPYSDKPGKYGLQLEEKSYFRQMAKKMFRHGFQMNTHAIGDSANRLMLDVYAGQLKPGNDKRWRIEHAQIVAPGDLRQFGEYNILPSIQPTHATSDMYWADERLGEERIKTAYAYRLLLKNAGLVANGSDFPVEDINPLYGFYAAVARKDHEGYPEGGFQPEQALTRKETLKGMTTWAAYANFEEKEKGSIEAGKVADFVVLEQDIMKAPSRQTYQTAVVATYIGGERVYPSP